MNPESERAPPAPSFAELEPHGEVTSEPDWGPDPVRDDVARVARLHGYRILDSAVEEPFERIIRWARERFRVPIALVSLVDMNRQWFKAACGLEVRETARDVAFCNHTILHSRPLVVPDATKDPRFRDNPLVTGEPGIRFYAGAPIITADRFAVGTVCLIDKVPREFPLTDRVVLSRLAAVALSEMEARSALLRDGAAPAP